LHHLTRSSSSALRFGALAHDLEVVFIVSHQVFIEARLFHSVVVGQPIVFHGIWLVSENVFLRGLRLLLAGDVLQDVGATLELFFFIVVLEVRVCINATPRRLLGSRSLASVGLQRIQDLVALPQDLLRLH